MKNEFKRFNLEKLGLITIIFEILGAAGLLLGLLYQPLLLLSAGGFTLMMFIALIVRIKSKDGLLVSLPAIFYMFLNAYIFFISIYN